MHFATRSHVEVSINCERIAGLSENNMDSWNVPRPLMYSTDLQANGDSHYG